MAVSTAAKAAATKAVTSAATNTANKVVKAATNTASNAVTNAAQQALAMALANQRTTTSTQPSTLPTNAAGNSSSSFANGLANSIYNAIPSGGDYSYTPTSYMQTSERKLMDAATLAKIYGLDYNYNNILATLMKGVNTGYGTRYAEQSAAEDKYYDNAAVTQNTLADTLRQQQSQAIMAGANRGTQAANALSAVLGTSQQFSDSATLLAQDRTALAKEYAASQASTAQKALDTYNTMGQQLADISKNVYSTDTSAYVGELDYNSNVNTSNAQLQAQSLASKTQWETTLANDITSAYNAYYNGQITLQQAQIQAGASIESAKLYGVDAATATGAANTAIAKLNASNNTKIAQIQTSGTLSAAQTAANATTNAAQTAANATTNAANTTANGYAQQAATAAQQTAANAITNLISGYNQGYMNSSDAKSALQGYLASGTINQSTYDAILDIFKPKNTASANSVINTTPEYSSGTGSSSWWGKVLAGIAENAPLPTVGGVTK